MTAPPGDHEPGPARFRLPGAAAGRSVAPNQTAQTERIKKIRQKEDQRTRRTVDLSLATHRALDVWQRDAADRLGLARVTGQEVLTALVEQLLTDSTLSAQITRSIQSRR